MLRDALNPPSSLTPSAILPAQPGKTVSFHVCSDDFVKFVKEFIRINEREKIDRLIL